jgi:hypothetical protein
MIFRTIVRLSRSRSFSAHMNYRCLSAVHFINSFAEEIAECCHAIQKKALVKIILIIVTSVAYTVFFAILVSPFIDSGKVQLTICGQVKHVYF